MPGNHEPAAVAPPMIATMAGGLLFLAATVLSAALLFLVEPMVAKMLLPRFGGSAAVWSVAIVFFQAALLAGYLYAHALIRWLPAGIAGWVHLAVLAAGCLALPIGVGIGTAGASPTVAVLLALLMAVGLPFVALSANAPLLQALYARSGGEGRRDPYPLYAASNAGSLVALLAYPFLIEPATALSVQTRLWAAGYAGLIAVIAAALVFGRPFTGGPVVERMLDRRWPRWAGLALVPSAGLVAVTAHISVDVAAAPFLWVVPLALYLATFVLAFSGRGRTWLGLARAALPVLLILVAAVQGFGLRFGFLPDVALHLATFFVLALVFHGMLAACAPEPEALTSYYVALSAGGLIGGVASALVAPAVFSFVAEYPLVLVAAAFAAPWRMAVVPAVAALIVLPGLLAPSAQERITRRSFYGVHALEVTPGGTFRVLKHGQEIHGAVRLRNADGAAVTGRPKPLTYYDEQGPISWAIDAARQRKGGPIRIAAVGLGAGSMACLQEPGDSIDFYEIDPEIIRIARDPGLFGFLNACAPQAPVIEGDARLTLAASAAQYDILIIDAFSSDAIPAHLLTREAMATYMQRIAPGGILVMHISNNHLRLNEIVAATAQSLDLKTRIFDEYEDDDHAEMVLQPTVAAIARSDADFGALARAEEWPPAEPGPKVRPWSDDYSNLLAAIIAKARED
jgi:hypothetical protein